MWSALVTLTAGIALHYKQAISLQLLKVRSPIFKILDFAAGYRAKIVVEIF
ncbi:hypothetical protein [Nostoc sp. FACHB-280]|uniref:hypothetical protein n=1 Tax=Nostoc sp. FACHB-280 TaxID=2692839 RepID=UPI00168B68E3|nr:hypothetical protein [Nostoc sp. FACHB-280]MBD2498561.1 hypothetical protein [Nostoc sp. FACHB-280]